MNKSEAKYAAASADLIAQFIEDADDKMISEFCSRFEILVGKKDRKKAEKMAQKLSDEFLSPKEAQKSGSSSVNKDSPPPAADVSVFGTKRGTKQFTIDELLAMGTHTLAEIENESGASIETVKRRIRTLKSLGYQLIDNDGRIMVPHNHKGPTNPNTGEPYFTVPSEGWSSTVGTTEKGEESGKKRKRKRKK